LAWHSSTLPFSSPFSVPDEHKKWDISILFSPFTSSQSCLFVWVDELIASGEQCSRACASSYYSALCLSLMPQYLSTNRRVAKEGTCMLNYSFPPSLPSIHPSLSSSLVHLSVLDVLFLHLTRHDVVCFGPESINLKVHMLRIGQIIDRPLGQLRRQTAGSFSFFFLTCW
jgi:hypothetical protein